MKDKQIIIDGVDVSGCDFLAKEDDYSSYSGITYAYKGQCMCSDEEMCKEHPKCFYKKVLKQLKRKEQELIDYKKQFKADTKEMEDYQNEIARHLESIEYWQHQAEAKEQECDELKEQLERADEDIKMKCTRCAMTNLLDEQLDQLKAELTRANCQIADDEILQCDMREAIEELKAENEELKKQNNQFDNGINEQFSKIVELEGRNNLLKAILTQIKEIAEQNIYLKSQLLVYDGDLGQLQHQPIVKILQKISECEVVDET